MKTRYFVFLLLLFFLSCKVPFVQFEEEYLPSYQLKNNIAEIICYHSIYHLKDTTYYYLNNKNYISKSISRSNYLIDTTYYFYNPSNKLIRLENYSYKKESNKASKTTVVEQKFDHRNNLINTTFYENGIFKNSTDIVRNSKTHNTESVYFKKIDKSVKLSKTDYIYNYKKRSVSILNESEVSKLYMRHFFNKKGLIIKDQFIDKETDSISMSIIKEYDKKKNIAKKLVISKKGTQTSIYKYEYDENDNIIKSQEFLNDKLFEEYIYTYKYKL